MPDREDPGLHEHELPLQADARVPLALGHALADERHAGAGTEFMFVRRSPSPPPRHRGPRGPLLRPDAVRPSGTLHRSAAPRPSRRRRLAQAGAGGAVGVALAGGLAAVLATSATAAPAAAVVVPESGSLVGGVAAHSNAELISYTAAQQAAAERAAALAAQQAAARKAAVARAAAASRSEARASLSATGGSFSGEASWYGPGFVGHRTSSGTPYNPNALTAASKTLPLGSHLRVCYHGSCVTVLINDRGPYVAGRILDLSEAAAADIGLKSAGVGWVTATPVG
ncbi:MAG TPA: septal ring lytic transglycosylase RlpA family protein [Mycobacteriales bacterium]